MLLADLILSFICISVGLSYSITKMCSLSQSSKRKIILIFFLSFFLIISNVFIKNYNAGVLKLYLNFIILFSLVKIIYRCQLDKSIILSFFTTCLVVISEFVFTLILVILKIDFNAITIIPFSYTTVNVIIAIIMLIIVNLKLSKYIFIKVESILSKNILILTFIIVFGFDSLLIQNADKIGRNAEYIMNFTLLIVFLIIIYFLLKEKNSNINISKKYDQMLENITNYEQIIHEQNKKSHEFKNQLAVINGYVNQNNKKLKNYLKEILTDASEVDTFFMKEIVKIPAGGLKGLLYYKLHDMKKKKINYYINVSGKSVELSKKVYSSDYKCITKVIGIYLDNAIQSAENSNDKIIEIYINYKNNKYVIDILNSFNEKFDFSKIGNYRFTTKGKNRGYGLSLVKEIIESTSILETNKSMSNNLFKQTLIINLEK